MKNATFRFNYQNGIKANNSHENSMNHIVCLLGLAVMFFIPGIADGRKSICDAEVKETFENEVVGVPIVISTGQHEVWGSPKILKENVVIEKNASLHITSLVLAGKEVSIHVKRGGKLTIENGEIRRYCETISWGGIWVEGNRSKEQPEVDIYNPEVSYSDENVAGVLVLLNAKLIGGRTVVQDGRYGDPDNWSYFGGVVIAENTDFLDNKRGVAFMSYPYPTKSYFLDCNFIETGAIEVANSMGITIWNTVNLLIEGCYFKNLDEYGIHGWNFGANISKGNRFEENRRAIDIYYTFPLSSPWGITIGPDDFDDEYNYFKNNQVNDDDSSVDIVAESADFISRLTIQNNDFSYSRYPIIISGKANYDIKGNKIYNSDFGISALNTGSSEINGILCNSFHTIKFYCIGITGDNGGVRIKDNDFYYQHPTGTGWSPIYIGGGGKIQNTQGSPIDPADNCFFEGGDAFFLQSGASPFSYFADEVSMPDNCELLPESDGSFTVVLTGDGPDNCALNPPVDGKEHDISSLNQKRLLLQQAFNALENNPDNLVLQSFYKKANEQKEEVYKEVLRQLLITKDYDLAEQLILQDGGERAARWQIGLKLLQGDYLTATNLLNDFPRRTDDDIYFTEIMRINVNHLQAKGAYTLNVVDEELLYEIAYTDSPYRSYARSLLSLLKGAEFNNIIELKLKNRGREELQKMTNDTTVAYRVYPNPASESVTVRYPLISSTSSIHLEVMNMQSGKLEGIYTMPGTGKYKMDTNGYIPGVYTLLFKKGKEMLHVEKLLIIR